jgi:hypothetical protein
MSAMLEDSLSVAILRMLAQEPAGAGVSLPRLGKRLGQGASVLMRRLTLPRLGARGAARRPLGRAPRSPRPRAGSNTAAC